MMGDMKVMKKVMNKGPVNTFGRNERTFDVHIHEIGQNYNLWVQYKLGGFRWLTR